MFPVCLFLRFRLSKDHLKHFEKRMVDEVNRGLSKETHADANVKSFVTYVSKLPTGREFGKYLALDLGGTNFRVILAELTSGTRSVRIKTAKFLVSFSFFLAICSLKASFIGGFILYMICERI